MHGTIDLHVSRSLDLLYQTQIDIGAKAKHAPFTVSYHKASIRGGNHFLIIELSLLSMLRVTQRASNAHNKH